MFRVWVIILFLMGTLVVVAKTSRKHRDYVPDEKTALRIGEAVLIAQFGEDSVKGHGPLRVDNSNKEYWIVEVPGEPTKTGGGPNVWINRYSGCLSVAPFSK